MPVPVSKGSSVRLSTSPGHTPPIPGQSPPRRSEARAGSPPMRVSRVGSSVMPPPVTLTGQLPPTALFGSAKVAASGISEPQELFLNTVQCIAMSCLLQFDVYELLA
eukprot:3055531-Amphidinium_carterae.1